jgi:hypothetical protein
VSFLNIFVIYQNLLNVCISVTVISTYRMTLLNGALKTLDPTCEFSPVILEHLLYNIFCRMSNY